VSTEKPLILVVDDEPDIRELIKDILEDEAYRVVTASNGEEARLVFTQNQPQLVLLDIWMPDVDGISLLKEFKQQNAGVTIVMMSGHGTIETAVEATRSGASDFIEKPLSMAKLLRAV
jgi:DNA-binding NtrC family response regulator